MKDMKIIITMDDIMAINLTQIRMIDALTKRSSCITWVDGSTKNIDIPFKDLMKALYDQEIEEDKKDPLELTIEELNLSVGSFNALKRAGINNVADIIKHTHAEISAFKTCGRKRAMEIQYAIEDLGFKLKED